MANVHKKLVRLAFGGACVALLAQACGGLDSGTVTVVPDHATAGSSASGGKQNTNTGGAQTSAGTPGAGQGGAPGGEAGEPSGMGGAVGGAGSECTEGSACSDGPEGGICVAGTCSSCEGPKDDLKCVKAYGKGYLCIDSGCIKAQCRVDEGCAAGSGICTNHQCVPCTKDADCPVAGAICNTTSGSCVLNPSCGNLASGSACPINSADLCCGPNTFCAAVSCCGVEPCRTNPKLAVVDGKCNNGQCVSNNCSAPQGNVRYVDPQAADGGSGSSMCPYSHLTAALQDLQAAGGQIIVKFGSTMSADAAFSIGPAITIVGADVNFAACTPATCAASSRWPLITTGNHRAFNLGTPGNRTIHFIRLAGVPTAEKDTSDWSAIYTATATLNLDHVEVSGYQYGVYSDTASSVKIGDAVHLHDNQRGVYVADGDGAAGGNVEVTVTKEATNFDQNTIGVTCHGNGVFKASAPPAGPKLTALFSISNNESSGVYWACSVTQGLLDGLEASGNGTNAMAAQLDGATLFAHSSVKVRNSYFHDNKGSGIRIPSNGTNSADGLTKIDLGANVLAGAGKNTFAGNVNAGLCIEKGPADAATASSLPAEGNVFQTINGVCKFSRAATCTGGVDFSNDCANAADLKNCTPISATCQ
jgi:hypothetical protein